MKEPQSTQPSSRAILHVSESFAGGVLAAILDYVRSTPMLSHHLVYAERADAPVGDGVLAAFATVTRLPSGHLRRVIAVRHKVGSLKPRVIHAHSSFAGAYVRLAVSSKSCPIVYTPHCYSFERGDIGPLSRRVFQAVEFGLAANTSVFAACSPREETLSRWPTSRAQIVLLPNIPPSGNISGDVRASSKSFSTPLTIAGAGRPSAQKDPQFFLSCVSAASSAGVDLKAIWIGGDPGFGAKGQDLGVEVTGWVPRSRGLEIMATADIYLHTGLWEGFPLAVLEAVSLGVATAVRDIPAFEGIDLVKIKSERDFVELIEGITELKDQQDIWRQDADALAQFTHSAQHAVLNDIYGENA